MVVSGGVQYPYVADIPPCLGERKDDKIDNILVARRLLSECFVVPPPPPDYDAEGIFRQSLVPMGQLGEYWFFNNDPDAVYAVPFGAFPKSYHRAPGKHPSDAIVDYMKSRVRLYAE